MSVINSHQNNPLSPGFDLSKLFLKLFSSSTGGNFLDMFSGFKGSWNKFFNELSGGASFGRLLGALVNRITAEHLTGAEQEANQFSHDEAAIGRDWQEYFYNKYQSPEAMVGQYQNAGLNPALMYGQGFSSSPVSSGSPSSVNPQGSNINPMELISSIMSLSMRKKEMDADLKLKGANAYYLKTQGDFMSKEIESYDERLERERKRWEVEQEIRNKNVEEIDSKVKVNLALEGKYIEDKNLANAEKLVADWDAKLKEVDFATRSDYNQACLKLVQSEEQLNQLQGQLAKAQKEGRVKETEYLQKRIDNLQREQDDAHNNIVAVIDKLQSEKKLTDKEVEYYKDKYNLQVISAVNGAVNAAKFAPGTRFQGGSMRYTRYLDDLGKVAETAGKSLTK